MSEEIISTIKKAADDATDCVVVIKDGQVESITHLDFGEIHIKFHDSKVKNVDTTQKTKY